MTTILYTRRYNENFTTPMDPYKVWVPGLVDLSATGTFCRTFDDDGHVIAPLYELREVALPSWLPAEEWIAHKVSWQYLWAVVPYEAPEIVQRALVGLPFEHLYLVAALLKAKPRKASGASASMRAQVWAWIFAGRGRAPSPLERHQWAALDRAPWESKRLAEALYRERFYAPPNGARIVAPVGASEGA